MTRNYIIYAPSYTENSGGIIFQHNLVHELNRLGERALLWPMEPLYKMGLRERLRRRFVPTQMRPHPDLDTPVARRTDLTAESVVVYSEIVPGNPLGARSVVRWLLYKPGLIHPYRFGRDEMFFRVGEICDIPEITDGAPDLYLWKVNRTYRDENRPDRRSVCYIVRKGSDKPRIPQTEDPAAICVDGMSHAETNEVFNRCHTFYSYDEATMYSQYAAVTGCTSVVIPGLYPSREEWVKNHELARYGVAYGLDDIAHANATRHMVLDLLLAEESKGRASVENFIVRTHECYWSDAPSSQTCRT